MMPKISEYGLIGNCRSSALISKSGELSWCCLPYFDSPSFFASILDDNLGGKFFIKPVLISDEHQDYLDDTNVLQTTFTNATGSVKLLDCFSISSEEDKRKKLLPPVEILRILEGQSGEMTFQFHFEPRPDYGSKKISIKKQGALGFRCDFGAETLFFQSTLPMGIIDLQESDQRSMLVGEFKIRAGETLLFSFCYSNIAPGIIPCMDKANERFDETVEYWKKWISQCTYKGPYEKHVRRSALALKLLTFAPSGAIVAAPTTSLPERPGGVRNWDYRYCWLRDASFTVRSFVAIGFYEEARAYVNWMLHTTHLTSPRVKVLYSMFGDSKIPERILPWLHGYLSSTPVRVGNAADRQFQLDVYGEVLNAIYYFAPSAKDFDSATRNFVLNLGKSVCELWKFPDEGIWEVRSQKVHHTHSKVLAWVALDRIVKLAEMYDWKAPIAEFRKIAEEIQQNIEAHSYNDVLKSYTRSYHSDELDASVLVMPLVDYCDADSSRMLATTKTINKQLSRNGLIYRYQLVDDGLPGKEGAFGICSFWMIQNLAKSGKIEEAKKCFDSILQRANSLGLWSEEIDPDNDEFLGNYPQAFSHTGLINAALTLKEEMLKRGKYQ